MASAAQIAAQNEMIAMEHRKPKRSEHVKLTDRFVANRKPPATGRLDIWDTLLPGFGLRVSSTGRKTWIAIIRPDGAKHSIRKSVGTTKDTSLADARTKARQEMEGASPPAPIAFKDLAERFLEHGRTKRGRPLRPATKREYRRALMTNAASLHKKPVQDIRRGDVASLLRTVATKRGATTAMRTRAALMRFWGWMLAADHVDANVVTGTEGYDVPKRKRVLTDAELRAIWAATADQEDFSLIVRLCLWTGARRSEVGGMALSELNDRWTVLGTRTKNHRDLILPLPQQALEALERWPLIDGRDMLFGRVRLNKPDTGFQGWSDSKARLDKRAGIAEWDLHDLRRSVQTRMAGLGIPKEIVNRVLNHAQGPIDEAYDVHDYASEKRAALEAWADELETIVSKNGTSTNRDQ